MRTPFSLLSALAALFPTILAGVITQRSYATEPCTASGVRCYDFAVRNVTLAPDGFARQMLTINGQYPGPLIEAYTGDIVRVRVTNELNVPTGLHWHGMFMKGVPWLDGVPGQTQCPIPPGGEYTYEFKIDGQWGTYWWHSHYMSQYVDGLLGPFIVHNTLEEPYLGLYDEEYTVMLSDWYHTYSTVLLEYYISPASEGNEPIPDNGLINGLNSFNCSLAPSGSTCTPNSPKASFSFVEGKRYRLRIINTSAFSVFTFSIDNHTMTVIEADGTDVHPVQVNSLPINVAQRYSVIVNANQQPAEYFMRAELETSCYPVLAPQLEAVVQGTILYVGAKAGLVSTGVTGGSENVTECQDFDPKLLKPFYAEDAPVPNQQVTLNVVFQTDALGVNRAYINNNTYTPDFAHPTLLDVWSNQTSYYKNQYTIEIESEQVVEIVINNYDTGEHPFHFHGHHFYILGFGNGTYDAQADAKTLNLINPIRRDTSTIPALGWTVIRYVANNPGVWAFHCHIEWHVEVGLVVQFIEIPSQIQTLPLPQTALDLCAFNYTRKAVY
ncbi:multi-copper oxidase [Endogone sp. FLAS-F59071]|nr:multi-copper oxidase [Endogone sp. FLAS-F59071]|eukprot:RUS16125.1 multi-copper oxidase [Endogone sp. FLAS-F59071]